MAGQLEDAEDTDEADYTEDGKRHGLVVCLGLVDQERHEGDIVGHDGDQVDQVHEVLEEGHMVRAGGEPEDELGREPDDADGLDDEERFVRSQPVVDLRDLGHGAV